MASGTLGQSNLSATTDTTVYTVPAGTTSSFSVNICNRNATSAFVRIAIAASGTPGVSEYIEFGALVEGNGVLERTGLVASANKNVVVHSDSANVTVNVYGYEE